MKHLLFSIDMKFFSFSFCYQCIPYHDDSPVVVAPFAVSAPVGPSVDVERAAFDPHGRFGRNVGTVVAAKYVSVRSISSFCWNKYIILL